MHHSIELESLSFSYPDGRKALDRVTLSIQPCEKVALVGPNGTGKSTLLLHLNGILRASSGGGGRVAGLELREENMKRVRGALGLVFQDPDDQLFSPTVFDDVAFGPIYQGLPMDQVQVRVERALAAVYMSDYVRRAPHRLSTGEKKRIAIATVLAMEPEILALDEPTAGLDPRTRRGLIRLLAELPLTMLISTHDLRMVEELLARTVVMDRGAIVADGPTAEILADEALLRDHGLEL